MRPKLFAGEAVAHGNADRVCAAVNSQHHQPSFEMVQRRQARQAQHLCIPGQRPPPCLPSTLSLRLQLSPSRRASTMRLARRSEKAVSPSAIAQSDTTAAGLLDTLSLSRSSRRRWSLRSSRRRYAMKAIIFLMLFKLADIATVSSFPSSKSTRNSRIQTSSPSTALSLSTQAHTSSWTCARMDLWPTC